MIKYIYNKIYFFIGKKLYFTNLNNYLIIDFMNLEIGKRIIFFNSYFTNFKKIKLSAIILKHIIEKKISFKKKRRKNFNKTYIKYVKKTLLYIDNII